MKLVTGWHSDRLRQGIEVVRWGEVGVPVLVFPTAGGDAQEIERFGLVDAVAPLLAAGRVKLYSCDSLAGRAWLSGWAPQHAAALQNAYHEFVRWELVPFIHHDCGHPLEVTSAGASIGAFNAVAVTARYPDVFRAAIGMSGTYDLAPWLHGYWDLDVYFSSPLQFVPNLDGPHLDTLRRRFFLIAYGQGRWEDPDQSWRLAHTLGAKGIPNRVDVWGPEWDHDWPTWRAMLPTYLDQLAR